MYRSVIIVWAGPGFTELSLSGGDMLSLVWMMYLNSLFVWLCWLFVVGASVVFWNRSQDTVLGSCLVRCIVILSRFTNCSAFLPCALGRPVFEALVLGVSREGTRCLTVSEGALYGPSPRCPRSFQLRACSWLCLSFTEWTALLFCLALWERRRPDRLRKDQACVPEIWQN